MHSRACFAAPQPPDPRPEAEEHFWAQGCEVAAADFSGFSADHGTVNTDGSCLHSAHRPLASAGAAFLYATPIVALSEQVSWIWLAVLLVMTVAIGSVCITLRSRSLLVVSTVAMLTDLGFFVFKIGTTEPLLLWVFGLAFGLGLMAWAAYLEYRREGLLQHFRVFGRELKAWH